MNFDSAHRSLGLMDLEEHLTRTRTAMTSSRIRSTGMVTKKILRASLTSKDTNLEVLMIVTRAVEKEDLM